MGNEQIFRPDHWWASTLSHVFLRMLPVLHYSGITRRRRECVFLLFSSIILTTMTAQRSLIDTHYIIDIPVDYSDSVLWLKILTSSSKFPAHVEITNQVELWHIYDCKFLEIQTTVGISYQVVSVFWLDSHSEIPGPHRKHKPGRIVSYLSRPAQELGSITITIGLIVYSQQRFPAHIENKNQVELWYIYYRKFSEISTTPGIRVDYNHNRIDCRFSKEIPCPHRNR